MRRRIRGILMSGKQFSLDSHLDLFHGMESNIINRNVIDSNQTLPLVEDSNENEENGSSSPGIHLYYYFRTNSLSRLASLWHLKQREVNQSIYYGRQIINHCFWVQHTGLPFRQNQRVEFVCMHFNPDQSCTLVCRFRRV